MEHKRPRHREKIKYTDYEGNIEELITTDEDVYTMMDRFAKFGNLYSCFVDVNGKMIGAPIGPATNLGDFYDLFETPTYKQYYIRLKALMLERCKPHLFTREEGMPGKFSAAPISIRDELLGFWVLASYTEEETMRLRDIYKEQWSIAYAISQQIYNNMMLRQERENTRIANQKLEEALARERILKIAVSGMEHKHSEEIDEITQKLLNEVGTYLKLTHVYYFVKSESVGKYDLRTMWDSDEQAEEVLDDTQLFYDLDQSQSVLAYPILLSDTLYGKVFLVAEETRSWTQEELAYAKRATKLIQRTIEDAEGDNQLQKINNELIETYNNFNVGIFIRDALSGKVLFSNAKMNEMLGRDFTGGDSRTILTDLHDRFDGMDGIRKPFITREKVVNWRRYIQCFDAIMDITEIQIGWVHGEQASLIILRKANDL